MPELIDINEGKVRTTKHFIPRKLEYAENFYTRSGAMKREKLLKNQRNKEFYRKLINSSNSKVPSTRDRFVSYPKSY